MIFVFFKNIMQSFRTAAGMLAIPVVLVVSELGQILRTFMEEGYAPQQAVLQATANCFAGDAMLLLLPIVCTLAGSASFVEDTKNKFVRALLIRMPKNKYLWCRMLACALAGGVTVAVGMLLLTGALACFPVFLEIPEIELIPELLQESIQGLFSVFILYFIAGALWAGLGMFIAMLTDSVLVAYLAPFIVFYLLQILYERYLTGVKILSPKQWLLPDESWPGGKLGSGLLRAELLLIVMFCFIRIAGRRLQDG